MKTGWHDITTAEWLAMQGKEEAEIYELLTGRKADEALSNYETALVTELLLGFGKLPEVPAGVNVETETLGQFETARSFLKRFYTEDAKTYRVKAVPYVFGIYRSLKVGGVWSNAASMRLKERCLSMPADQVVPVALAILEQVEEVSLKYDNLAHDPEDSGNDEAGENDMDAFGFYPALHMLSGGDILKQEAIMQQSVRSVYTHLFYLKKLAQSQKQEANGQS